jgi:urea transport system substrate-binding protein
MSEPGPPETPSAVTEATGAPDFRVGSRLGKYRIHNILGRGGMGTVYEGEDTVIGRRVALKLLNAAVSADQKALRRLLSEAKAAGKLNHPNTVSLFDLDTKDGVTYIVMELVKGGSAADRLKIVGRFDWKTATRMMADACRGLAAAHQAGLIHRDIKPANIMIAGDGSTKLADFGLAKDTDVQAAARSATTIAPGTPYYMSPEQCQALGADARSDLYSLGASYYELLTGKVPFEGSMVQVLLAHCSAPAPDPRAVDPEIPEACAAIIAKAMEKDPDQRYQTAYQMLNDLDAAAGPKTGTAVGVSAIRIGGSTGAVPALRRGSSTTVPVAPDSGIARPSEPVPAIDIRPAPRTVAPVRAAAKPKSGGGLGLLPFVVSFAVVGVLLLIALLVMKGCGPAPAAAPGEKDSKDKPAATSRP